MNSLRVTIGVGCGLRANGSRISHADQIRMVMLAKNLLLTNCGGYTMTRAEGGWRDSTGTDWEEPSLGFVVLVDANAHPTVLAIAIRDIFEQKCVMLTTEEVNTRLV